MFILKLIRWPNLLIIVVTQCLLYFLVLIPVTPAGEGSLGQSLLPLILLVAATVLISAAGYIVNDIYDLEIDRHNKPQRVIIGKRVSVQEAWISYLMINILALIAALYLRPYLVASWMAIIFPLNIALLWAYSRYWKKQVLTGNLTVAFLCACVPGTLLLFDRLALHQPTGLPGFYRFMIIPAYTLFAFFSTLLREIIKDLEDMEGDRLHRCRTFPIVYGVPAAKTVATLFGLLLMVALILWGMLVSGQQSYFALFYLIIGLILPLLYLLLKIRMAEHSRDYGRLSSAIKYLMLSALIYLYVTSI